jgi:hypothetical protein
MSASNYGGGLGGDHGALAAETAGHDATQRRHEEHRDLPGETNEAEQHRRTGQPVELEIAITQ